MSALRISRPGQPTELIILDEGAVGRITGTVRRASINGALVVGESQRQRDLRLQREAEARLRAARRLGVVDEMAEAVEAERKRKLELQRAAERRYYAAHKDEIIAKQRARRRGVAFSIHPENRRGAYERRHHDDPAVCICAEHARERGA